MPLKKDGWQFNWRELARGNKDAIFFKLVKTETPFDIEGMLMLSIAYREMVQMNNIEIAPHNIGSNGKFDHVAGCLIAYACLKSFEWGKTITSVFYLLKAKLY